MTWEGSITTGKEERKDGEWVGRNGKGENGWGRKINELEVKTEGWNRGNGGGRKEGKKVRKWKRRDNSRAEMMVNEGGEEGKWEGSML